MDDGIRFAVTPEELHAAYRLRYKTYVENMGRFNDTCNHQRQELRDDYDQTARIVIAVKNNKVIGTLRVLWGKDTVFDDYLIEAYRLTPFLNVVEPSKICIVERLMVDENNRGSATMLRMYNTVMRFILTQRIELLLINSEAQHSNSYIKLGCKPFTKQYLYPGIGPVTPMALVVGDYQHLQQIGSPFSLLATTDDVDYCQHTRDLIETINCEAARSKITRKNKHVSIFPLPPANLPFYNRKSPEFNNRLRIKVGTY